MALYGRTYSLGPTVRHIGAVGATGAVSTYKFPVRPMTNQPGDANDSAWIKEWCNNFYLESHRVGKRGTAFEPSGLSYPAWRWLTGWCGAPPAKCTGVGAEQQAAVVAANLRWYMCAKCIYDQYSNPENRNAQGKTWAQIFGWSEDDYYALKGSSSQPNGTVYSSVDAMVKRTAAPADSPDRENCTKWLPPATPADGSSTSTPSGPFVFDWARQTGKDGKTTTVAVDVPKDEDLLTDPLQPSSTNTSAPPSGSGSGNLLLYVAAGAALAYVFSKR